MAALTHIDVYEVLCQRLPAARYLPRWTVWPLERLIRQREMNHILDVTAGLRGAEFCRRVMEELDFKCSFKHGERLPAAADSRVVYVCNHPLGGLDGMALIDLLSAHHGRQVRFVVNDLLNAVEPLSDVFLPVNKHGAQSRQAAADVDDAFAGDDPIVVFPAGLVSRRDASGDIADRKWHKMFVTRAVASGRDVVPLHFEARNSKIFYNFAYWRERLGIRFNYEMVLLPQELFKSRGKHATVHVGRRIACETLNSGTLAQAQADDIRALVHMLPQGGDRATN